MKAHFPIVWLTLALVLPCSSTQHAKEPAASRVEIPNDGWKLAGDLLVPHSPRKVPAVLMLNKAAGSRKAYTKLAGDLAARGIASLRLDLRGHGESTNLGTFVPGPDQRMELITESDLDVIAGLNYLRTLAVVDSDALAVIGASYSGEKMMDAARKTSYARAYVTLSPGSLTDESIRSLDSLRIPWLYVAGRDERHMKEVTAAVREMSSSVEMVIIPGKDHATVILDSRPDIAERIAVWLESSLRPAQQPTPLPTAE